MKCTRCGKEMTIKPVETGVDGNGEPVFTRYAFCYNCKIKVNLDKQEERKAKECEIKPETERTVVKSRKKSKGAPSIPTGKRRRKRGRKRAKEVKYIEKERRGGGFLKFLVFLIILAALAFAGYTYREPIAGFAKQMYEKYVEKSGDASQDKEQENGKDTDQNGADQDSVGQNNSDQSGNSDVGSGNLSQNADEEEQPGQDRVEEEPSQNTTDNADQGGTDSEL